MLIAAALVPDTALLVPGASGRSELLAAERSAALEAVRRVVAAGPGRLVVVAAPAPRGPGLRTTGPVRPTLAAAGLADSRLGRPVRTSPEGATDPTVVDHVGAAVGLWTAQEAGWTGAVEVVALDRSTAQEARALGRRAAREPVGLVLVGSLSARRGPDAPIAEDERAEAFDRQLLADLSSGTPDALGRLGDVPQHDAEELAVSAWAPWQVLVGACDGPLTGTLHHTGAPLGATYAVLSWVPA